MGNHITRVIFTILYYTLILPFGIGVRLLWDRLDIKEPSDNHWQERESANADQAQERRQY